MQTETRVSVKLISPNPLQPRRFFDPGEMAEMEESIKAVDVLQPILIRPAGGGYQIVAGERRWRAAKAVFGEDYEIPAVIREMTDEEADKAALIENIERANMSPAEEAQAAAKILGRAEGDRDEAARQLGWDRKKLDKRLALMNCSESVLTALTERKIQLGYAELLAAAPKAQQDVVIEKLLAAPSLPPLAQFKAQLEQISLSMASAIFDKGECTNCPHNSSVQATMFSEAIADGNCTNAECFNAKTMAVLDAKKTELEADFPLVRIVSPGDNFTLLKLVAEGATGVGEEQAKACRACKNYGAAVSNIPGKMGDIARGLCFDSACNTGKVAARLKAEKEAAKAKEKETEKASTEKSADGKGSKASASPKTQSSSEPAKVQLSQRVIDYRVELWRNILKKEILADDRKNLALFIGTLMTIGGGKISSTKLMQGFSRLANIVVHPATPGEAAFLVLDSDDALRSKMLAGAMISIIGSIENSYLPGMLAFMKVDMTQHWKLDEAFLNLLTKSEIGVIADELGLKAALGGNYPKIMAGKKDEIVKALLKVEGFDYKGKVPSVLQYES
jgi:ParB family chromosome partitioning protein